MNEVSVRLDIQIDQMRGHLNAFVDAHFERIKKSIDEKVASILTPEFILAEVDRHVSKEVDSFISSVKEDIRRRVVDEFAKRINL